MERAAQTFPTLTPAQIERVSAVGHRCSTPAGEVLFNVGDQNARFFVVLSGGIEVVQPAGSARTPIVVHGPGQFTGEINMLSARRSLVRAQTTVPSELLIVDNHAYQAIISAEHDSNAPNNASVIDSSTIANNVVDGSYVIRNGIGLTLTNSIIDVADTATLDYSGNASYLHVSYVLADDTVGLPADPTIAIGAPTFIDAAHGDYRLRYSRAGGVTTKSLGLDFAPAIAGNDVDVRAAPHDQDLAAVADTYGPRDLGAFEMQNYTDRIFVDGFGDVVLLAY